MGRVGDDDVIGTIEPWHGSKVVVYRRSDGAWTRTVVDDSITDGHTMATGDFDGDGRDEMLVGERNGKRSVYLYRLTSGRDGQWRRQILDVVCVGTATANVKWYENRR